MTQFGNTREQGKAYKVGLTDAVYRGIKPRMYLLDGKIKEFLPNLLLGRELDQPEREDAFRIYLGLDQKNNTFGISDYKPKNSKQNKYYFKINNFLEEFSNYPKIDVSAIIKSIVNKDDTISNKDKDMTLGTFKWSCGQDKKGYYISYYDKWDLDIPLEKDGFIGKPFEIYDRIYYNPETFEPVNMD